MHSITATRSHTLSLLDACSDVYFAEQIHAIMLKSGLIFDTVPLSRLLAAICMSSPAKDDLAYARSLFDRIRKPNTFMWNVMIRGYSSRERPEEALVLYNQMVSVSVPPNDYTFPFILTACVKLPPRMATMPIHSTIIKTGFNLDLFTINSLIHAYAVPGMMEDAVAIFDAAPISDVISWNSIIGGYTRHGEVDMAYRVFREMPKRNVVSWTSMISGFIHRGLDQEGLNLFEEMLMEGIEPDNTALASALSACAHLGAGDQGKWIHAYIDRNRIPTDAEIDCALIEMYAKCGELEKASNIFRRSKNRLVHIWTAMISGFAIHGQAQDAINLFAEMNESGIKPNAVTLTAVLSACSRAGLVEEGKSIFTSINAVHSLKPSMEHYGCLVDLLGRVGLLDETWKVVETMPFEPNAEVLGALLKACRIHGKTEQARAITRELIRKDPRHGGRYIHAASISAAAGDWEEAVRIRMKMKEEGVIKDRGCSRITVYGIVHNFFAGDQSHLRIEEINEMWNQAVMIIRKQGYRPVLRDLLLDLDDNEKQATIERHSEKLALCFGLISTEPGMTIQIFKNLRVCEDCHTVMKMISKIYSREIVMRDRIRFHHFKNGACSCRDYW